MCGLFGEAFINFCADLLSVWYTDKTQPSNVCVSSLCTTVNVYCTYCMCRKETCTCEFTTKLSFNHVTSSSRYPQSNGKAEATVKSMKKIIRAAWNGRQLDEDMLCRALLQYRNTPSCKDGLSPAEKLYGRPVQDTLPAHRRSFTVEWQRSADEADKTEQYTKEEVEVSYSRHARSLPDVGLGSSVAIQNPKTKIWDIYGRVVDIGPHRRYFVKTHSGRILVRNCRFLHRRVPLSVPVNDKIAPQASPTMHREDETNLSNPPI